MCDKCLENPSQRSRSSRRAVLGLVAASTIGLAFGGAAMAKDTKTPPKPQNVLSPDASLERLLKGNQRYVEGLSRRHDFKHEREVLMGGQNPYAGILSCADSRIAPEYAFDSGRGDPGLRAPQHEHRTLRVEALLRLDQQADAGGVEEVDPGHVEHELLGVALRVVEQRGAEPTTVPYSNSPPIVTTAARSTWRIESESSTSGRESTGAERSKRRRG